MAYRREHAPSEQLNVLMDTGTAHEDVFSDSGRLFFMTTCRQRDVMCNLASRTTPVQPVAFLGCLCVPTLLRMERNDEETQCPQRPLIWSLGEDVAERLLGGAKRVKSITVT